MVSCWADFWASLAVDEGANMAKRAEKEATGNKRDDVTIQIWEMVKDRHMAGLFPLYQLFANVWYCNIYIQMRWIVSWPSFRRGRGGSGVRASAR